MRGAHYLPALNSALCILIIFLCLSLFLTRGLGLYVARAVGESMLPAIPKDAFIILSSKQPEIGDIVHVKNEKCNYAHRLVAIEGDRIVTKGDNCESSEIASLADVRGVVIFHSSFTSFLLLAFVVIGVEAGLGALWAGKLLQEVRHRRSETSRQRKAPFTAVGSLGLRETDISCLLWVDREREKGGRREVRSHPEGSREG